MRIWGFGRRASRYSFIYAKKRVSKNWQTWTCTTYTYDSRAFFFSRILTPGSLMISRLFRQFAHFLPRLPDLCGRSAEVQPLREGHRLHPEEHWEPDGAAVAEGGAGWSLLKKTAK